MAAKISARVHVPAPTTPLIGRHGELSAAKDLLWNPGVRLVTLLGLGGIGKTRLALEIATDLSSGPGFVDGVHVVDLSPVRDPALVPATIARALGVVDTVGGDPLTTLCDAVRAADVLVVLDNVEQVIGAAPSIAELLAAAPRLSVLATSRRALHLRGEHQIPVPPLALDDSVALFVARAHAVNPRFSMDESSTNEVESICTKLDGLPLAIELAAARSNVLSPAALRARLGRSLELLAGGPADQPDRLRSVQAMVMWSVDALTPSAQRCLAELAVFSGGWSVEGAESVCSDPSAVLDALGTLCEHHLVVRTDEGAEPRFDMFETVRECALGLLDEDSQQAVCCRHASFCLTVATDAGRGVKGADQAAWLDRVEVEHGNIASALAWSLEHDPTTALELAGRIGRCWLLRGYTTEALDWLERSLVAAPGAPLATRARALLAAGSIIEAAGDDATAEADYREALDIYTATGDRSGMAHACRNLGNACLGQSRYDESQAWYERSRALGEELGDSFLSASAVFSLGNVSYFRGDNEDAERRWTEAAEHFRAIGDLIRLTSILNNLAELAALRGDHATCLQLHEETLSLRRSLRDRIGVAQTMINLGHGLAATGDLVAARGVLEEALGELRALGIDRDAGACLYNLALVARAEGNIDEATVLVAESLATKSALGERFDIAACLELLAVLAAERGLGERGAQLLGAAAALRREIGARPLVDEPDAAELIETVRRVAGDELYEVAHAAGEQWSLDGAVAVARSVARAVRPRAVTVVEAEPERHPAAERLGLTSRELEVLGFLAQRYTDREIAATLVISVRTVTTHVGRILIKLGVDGRRQAASEAARLGLVAS